LDFDTILYANLEDFFFSLEDGKKSMELGLDTRTYLPPPPTCQSTGCEKWRRLTAKD
jgi:hypothetical protein